jgi:hypothetical protein
VSGPGSPAARERQCSPLSQRWERRARATAAAPSHAPATPLRGQSASHDLEDWVLAWNMPMDGGLLVLEEIDLEAVDQP